MLMALLETYNLTKQIVIRV